MLTIIMKSHKGNCNFNIVTLSTSNNSKWVLSTKSTAHIVGKTTKCTQTTQHTLHMLTSSHFRNGMMFSGFSHHSPSAAMKNMLTFARWAHIQLLV